MRIDNVKNNLIKIKYDIAKGEIIRHRNFEHEEHLMQEEYEAVGVAITSIIAWEKVRQEINDLFSKPACYMPNYDAYKMFLEIIDKHLQKTSETETWNGYHGQITAPKGTFERIISDTDDEDDI